MWPVYSCLSVCMKHYNSADPGSWMQGLQVILDDIEQSTKKTKQKKNVTYCTNIALELNTSVVCVYATNRLLSVYVTESVHYIVACKTMHLYISSRIYGMKLMHIFV